MTITYTIISIFLSLSILIYIYNKRKINELNLRTSDKKLGEYYYESIYHRNDGWTMKHYKGLYKQRLKELRKKENV